METKQLVNNLTLVLAYLNSWEEKNGSESVHRAWKGYDFDALDKLQDDGLIVFSYKAKSLYLTEEGETEAKELVKTLQKIGSLDVPLIER